MRPRVYISGPITLGDREHNFEQASRAHRELIAMGYAPMNPMLTMMLPWERDCAHRKWMEVDIAWISVTDVLLRLPGISVGADEEVKYANHHGIPVYYSLEDMPDA